ncbi:MAG: hypothetical protein LC772_12810, partial [Chloroflexi bacterium]|nr:hypothetical protein [Chloroflexota bacterium]
LYYGARVTDDADGQFALTPIQLKTGEPVPGIHPLTFGKIHPAHVPPAHVSPGPNIAPAH